MNLKSASASRLGRFGAVPRRLGQISVWFGPPPPLGPGGSKNQLIPRPVDAGDFCSLGPVLALSSGTMQTILKFKVRHDSDVLVAT